LKASWPFFTIWAARFYAKLGDAKHEQECLQFLDSVVTSDLFIPEKVAPVEGYQEWKENELEFGDRVVNGMRRTEGRIHTIKAPGYVCWACPLGWAHAEYILYEKTELPTLHELLPVQVQTIPRVRVA
jgi:GH15 family glucan-1,4-alpha-glucosidase